MKDQASKEALRRIIGDARTSRLGKRLPEDRRPALMISLGLAPMSEDAVSPTEMSDMSHDVDNDDEESRHRRS